MADHTIDVLMRVVGKSGALPADSMTGFTGTIGTDTLRDGFTAGEFCELREFDFSAGITSALSKKDKNKPAVFAAPKDAESLTLAEKREKIAQDQAKRAGKRLVGERVDMQPVDYVRTMDSMSTLLFKALTECETLSELSIVKRKASGSTNSGECYLRLDFQKVLFTKLEWKDEEHSMSESGTFIYRKVTIRYRPQTPGGALGNVVQATWSMPGAAT